jgi:hypothetical protein
MIMSGLVLAATLLRRVFAADREQEVTFECRSGGQRGLRQQANQGRQQQGECHRLGNPAAQSSQPCDNSPTHAAT